MQENINHRLRDLLMLLRAGFQIEGYYSSIILLPSEGVGGLGTTSTQA